MIDSVDLIVGGTLIVGTLSFINVLQGKGKPSEAAVGLRVEEFRTFNY